MSEKNLLYTFTKGRSKLLAYARRMLGSDDAEDALQEAFCRLWRRGAALAAQTDADKMALTVVRNISIDQLRKQKRQKQTTLDPRADEERPVSERASSTLYEEADGDQIEERFKAVEKLINDRLTPLQQRIIRQHDMEGDSYHDISLREQMTEAAVRQQLSRARKTIRQLYIEQREEQE